MLVDVWAYGQVKPGSLDGQMTLAVFLISEFLVSRVKDCIVGTSRQAQICSIAALFEQAKMSERRIENSPAVGQDHTNFSRADRFAFSRRASLSFQTMQSGFA